MAFTQSLGPQQGESLDVTHLLLKVLEVPSSHIMHETLAYLMPQLVHDIPSSSVIDIVLDGDTIQKKHSIPKGTPLTFSKNGENYSFKTVFDTNLHPLILTKTDLVDAQDLSFDAQNPCYLKIEIEALSDYSLSDDLTFYTNEKHQERLYNALFSCDEQTIFMDGQRVLDAAIQNPSLDEKSLIRSLDKTYNFSHDLLMEYSVFKEKFFFFSLKNVQKTLKKGEKMTLFLGLNHWLEGISEEEQKHLLSLHHVAICNLFARKTDPELWNDEKSIAPLIADKHKMASVHTQSVHKITTQSLEGSEENEHSLPSSLYHDQGQYFVFLDIEKRDPTLWYADLSCHNGDISSILKRGDQGTFQESFPIQSVTFKTPLTSLKTLSEGDLSKHWKALSFHYLNLPPDAMTIKINDLLKALGLKEQFSNIKIKTVQRRLKKGNSQTFAQGVDVCFQGKSSILLCDILFLFLSAQLPPNTFIQGSLQESSQSGSIKTWPPMTAQQTSLL